MTSIDELVRAMPTIKDDFVIIAGIVIFLMFLGVIVFKAYQDAQKRRHFRNPTHIASRNRLPQRKTVQEYWVEICQYWRKMEVSTVAITGDPNKLLDEFLAAPSTSKDSKKKQSKIDSKDTSAAVASKQPSSAASTPKRTSHSVVSTYSQAAVSWLGGGGSEWLERTLPITVSDDVAWVNESNSIVQNNKPVVPSISGNSKKKSKKSGGSASSLQTNNSSNSSNSSSVLETGQIAASKSVEGVALPRTSNPKQSEQVVASETAAIATTLPEVLIERTRSDTIDSTTSSASTESTVLEIEEIIKKPVLSFPKIENLTQVPVLGVDIVHSDDEMSDKGGWVVATSSSASSTRKGSQSVSSTQPKLLQKKEFPPVKQSNAVPPRSVKPADYKAVVTGNRSQSEVPTTVKPAQGVSKFSPQPAATSQSSINNISTFSPSSHKVSGTLSADPSPKLPQLETKRPSIPMPKKAKSVPSPPLVPPGMPPLPNIGKSNTTASQMNQQQSSKKLDDSNLTQGLNLEHTESSHFSPDNLDLVFRSDSAFNEGSFSSLLGGSSINSFGSNPHNDGLFAGLFGSPSSGILSSDYSVNNYWNNDSVDKLIPEISSLPTSSLFANNTSLEYDGVLGAQNSYLDGILSNPSFDLNSKVSRPSATISQQEDSQDCADLDLNSLSFGVGYGLYEAELSTSPLNFAENSLLGSYGFPSKKSIADTNNANSLTPASASDFSLLSSPLSNVLGISPPSSLVGLSVDAPVFDPVNFAPKRPSVPAAKEETISKAKNATLPYSALPKPAKELPLTLALSVHCSFLTAADTKCVKV